MVEKSAVLNQPNNKEQFEQGYLSISDQAVQKSLKNVINNKIDNHNDGQLDEAILDACIESVFFLGKLKSLNEIVTGGREDINNALEEYAKIIEKKFLAEKGGDNEKIATELKGQREKIVGEYMSRFTGKRFLEEINREYNERLQIPTHAYFMTVMTRKVSDKLMSFKEEESIDIKKLNSVATLFFDLDGLKMLNDMSLGGYTSGDKALWVMARALTDSELKKWASNLDIELVPAHRSGDEFLLGVVAEDDTDLAGSNGSFTGINGEKVQGVSLTKYIGEYVKNRVKSFGQDTTINDNNNNPVEVNNENKDNSQEKKNQVTAPQSMQDIIDFSDAEQRNKFERAIRKMPEEVRQIFNNTFVYQLSCSYGYATLNDAFKRNIEDKIDFNAEGITYEYIVYKLTGRGLVDSAIDRMKVDKKYSRLRRISSQNLRERLLEILYRTGREQRGWHIDKEDFAEIEKVLFKFRDEMSKLKTKNKRKSNQLNTAMEAMVQDAHLIEELKAENAQLQQRVETLTKNKNLLK